MVKIITDNLKQIVELCNKYHVASLYVFGSATGHGIDGNEFNSHSDVDLLVSFSDDTHVTENPFSYFDMLNELEALLGRPVDLVEEKALRNPYFIQGIEKTKRRIYVA